MTANNPAWLKQPLLGLLGGQLSSTQVGREIAYEAATKPIVYIIFNENRVPSSGDLDFIASVLNHQSEYIGKAMDFLVQEIRRDPQQFGVATGDVESIVSEAPVSGPSFTFYLDGCWCISFDTGKFKIAEGDGIIVNFEGENPAEFEDISDPAAWFNTDTNEWVEC